MKNIGHTTGALIVAGISLAIITACATTKAKTSESKAATPTAQTSQQRPSRVPATPYPIKYAQPNGDTLTIKLYGDEHHHWAETIDGYLLLQRNDGPYEYAYRDKDGKIVSTGIFATDAAKRDAKTVEAIAKCKQP
ncbi:MAG TPA: hypothetical protein VMW01_14565 [Williamwhitmania sp.]|nr:hypothetical protein [Williamwhitmania sp.]